MRRTPLQVLDLRGTACEIAHEMGRCRRARIRRAVLFWNRSVAEAFRGEKALLKRVERGFLGRARADLPEYLDEIRAMAEGADVPWKDLFRLNITELCSFAPKRKAVSKCTTVIVPFATRKGRRILIGHNEDWDPRRNDVFILRARLPECSYMVVAYDGYLPGLSTGLNSHGLCHAINYLPEPAPRIGIPRIFVTRHLVTASSIPETVRWIRGTHRAFSQSIHLAYKDRYLGIELTARAIALRRLTLPAAHSNHFLVPRLARLASRPSPSSRLRLAVARRLLRGTPAAPTPARAYREARAILADRSEYPYAIWREADCAEDAAASLVAAISDTASLTMRFHRRNPLAPAEYTLPLLE